MNKFLTCLLFAALLCCRLEADLSPASKPKESNERQNWIFAGSAVLTALAGVLFTSWDSGKKADEKPVR